MGCSETPALTPDPSPNGWARGAPRKGSDIRRDETSSGHADSTLSGVFGLKRQPRAANPTGGPGTNRHQPPISQSAADFASRGHQAHQHAERGHRGNCALRTKARWRPTWRADFSVMQRDARLVFGAWCLLFGTWCFDSLRTVEESQLHRRGRAHARARLQDPVPELWELPDVNSPVASSR